MARHVGVVVGNKKQGMVRGWWSAEPLDPGYEARMIREHENVIHYWVYRYGGWFPDLPREELVSEANLAALKAVRTWDRRAQFTTFLGCCIRYWFMRMMDNRRVENGRPVCSIDAEQWDDGPNLASTLASDDDTQAEVERKLLVELALSKMTDIERQCVEGMYLRQETEREIGERVGLAQMSVGRAAKRGIRRAQEALGL